MTALAKNREAYFDYEIKDTLEAGLQLLGHEVKSIKAGNVSLKGTHVVTHGGEAMLVNMHVSPYKYAGALPGYDPTRSRKLLLHRRELSSLIGTAKIAGLTIVPLELYTKKGLVKVRLGIGRGKKRYDKRATIKKREDQRKMARVLKSNK